VIALADQLTLIQSRGLPAEAAHWLVTRFWNPSEPEKTGLATARGRHQLALELQARGYPRGAAIHWPEGPEIRSLAARLQHFNVRLAWRGTPPYPARLTEALAEAAPAWLWICGDERRLAGRTLSVVGSRQSPMPLLAATRRLAQVLAEAGVSVVSGLAPGADTAAHEGARTGAAGTVAIPARGILQIDLAACQGDAPWMTALALDRPAAPFSAGLAIRRNDVIAAMGDGLVLVASGLQGGSLYAVRWALARGTPVWCFEAATRTPPANRALLRRGQARPLAIRAKPEVWVEAILKGLSEARSNAATPKKTGSPVPLDLF